MTIKRRELAYWLMLQFGDMLLSWRRGKDITSPVLVKANLEKYNLPLYYFALGITIFTGYWLPYFSPDAKSRGISSVAEAQKVERLFLTSMFSYLGSENPKGLAKKYIK